MFKIEPSTEILSRRDFAMLCNARRLYRAVEVGTDRGCFARDFLDRWHGELLFCVDPYAKYPEMAWDREADRTFALHQLAPHAARVRVVDTASPAAIDVLPRTFCAEFVYIDGAHDRASVDRDIRAWWDRLYPSGPTILAGHDFDDEHAEVRDAVTDFARDKGLVVRLTREGDSPPSWYVYRNEPAELCRLHLSP